jgi:hypothetical protein
MATFYPLIDGGIQQMLQVYRGLVGRKQHGYGENETVREEEEEEQEQEQEKEIKSSQGVVASSAGSSTTVG